ncbi:MAG: FMN reductase, partial [Mesorhizobium sp.]
AALVNDVAWWAKVLKTARAADAIDAEAKAA